MAECGQAPAPLPFEIWVFRTLSWGLALLPSPTKNNKQQTTKTKKTMGAGYVLQNARADITGTERWNLNVLSIQTSIFYTRPIYLDNIHPVQFSLSPNKASLPPPCPIPLSHLFLENNPLSPISAAYDCGTIHLSLKKKNTPKCLKTMHTWGCKTDGTQKTRKTARGREKCRVKGLERHILYGDAHRCSGTLRTATLLYYSILTQGVIYFAGVSSWIVWPVINHLVTVSFSIACHL